MASKKILWITFAVFVFWHSAGFPAGAQTKKLVIGISNPDAVTFFPLFIAKQFGYFKAEGLDPQLIVMNSDLSVKALVTGDVDYASSTASVAKAAAVGFPVKIIMSFFNGTDFNIVAKPEIKTPKELKGRIVAISRFGSAADFDLREALKHSGLDPARDVKILPVGSGSNRLVALLTGKVDAAIINVAESLRARDQGMRVLMSTGKFNRQTLTGLGVWTSKIANNPTEVKKMLRASGRALEDFKDRPEKIKPLLLSYTKIKPDQFDFVYQKNLEVLSPDGSLSDGDVSASYYSARKAAVNPPAVQLSDLIDLSLLKEAQSK